ncbi:MAG TPA: peptidylprolyl isomerase [Pyrinomonadaceae bacterium]|nr:peptidylprolyl isomerase [Pyrinomonadaceae bacterium]
MKKLINSSLALSAILFLASHAPAQKRTPRRAPTKPAPATTQKKDATPNPQVKPQPTPTPTPPPQPTPAPTPAGEPFDGATVEQMAAQCVSLETEAGIIELRMVPAAAPTTVRNFLNLVATGAYDTTTFSRVVKNFVIQGGNLSTRETLTPALAERSRRTIPDEPNPIKHVRGVVSMARPDTPNGATTNFFILVTEAAYLDGTFAAFGRVASGMEVVDAINQAEVEGEKPVKPVRIKRAITAVCPAAKPVPAM